MSDRYKVIERSESGHCCFECTVVDTTKISHTHFVTGEVHYEPVCECFDVEDAVMICSALNRETQ